MTNPFQGHFDGRGHTVTYSVKAGEKEHGLFPNLTGTAEAAAEVRDLKVVVEEYSPKKDAAGGALVCRAEKAVISGVSVTLNKYTPPTGGESAGGSALVGTVSADALVENCNVKAAAGDYRAFGGITYENKGTIKNSEFLLAGGASTLGSYGGIARISSGNIADCRVTLPEAVTAGENVIGGIAGQQSAGEITECVSVFQLTGVPSKNVAYIGGISAVMTGGILRGCSASGSVIQGWNNIGGLVGSANATTPVSIAESVSNVVSIGTPANRVNNHVGGIIGGAEMQASLTVRNCVTYTNVYGGVDYAVIGGIVGYYRFRTEALAAPQGVLTFTMEDSHSYANELNSGAGNFVGGALGYIGCPMDMAGNIVELPVHSVIRNCTASAKVVSQGQGAGGFLGYSQNPEPEDGAATFENCHAYGDVQAQASCAGGFAGLLDTRGKFIRFENCTAGGNVTASDSADCIGGFVGRNRGESSRFTGCIARGNVSGRNFIGGFVGDDRGAGSAYGTGCYAYGSVSVDKNYGGGFIGYSNIPSPQFNTLTDCHAFGDVIMKGGIGGGGFIGEVNGSTVRDCTASGDVTAASNLTTFWGFGGFVGNAADGNFLNSITGCKAYGNVDGRTYGQRVGGFAGEWGDKGGNAAMSNCESYGTVQGANIVGGFVGQLTSQTSVSNNASYCPALTCPGANKGSFAGNILDLSNHNLSNNKFTELPDCAPNGGAAVLLPAGGSVLTPEEIKVSPKSVLAVTLAPVGNATKVAFTFTNAAGYSLVSFELSTDGGKTYTALVWDKVALVDLPMGALTCANFTYTYAAPCTATTKVRVKITNGTDTVSSEFTYTT